MKPTEQEVFAVMARTVGKYSTEEADYTGEMEVYGATQNVVAYYEKRLIRAIFAGETQIKMKDIDWNQFKRSTWGTYKSLERMGLIRIAKDDQVFVTGSGSKDCYRQTRKINFYSLTDKGVAIAKKHGWLK